MFSDGNVIMETARNININIFIVSNLVLKDLFRGINFGMSTSPEF